MVPRYILLPIIGILLGLFVFAKAQDGVPVHAGDDMRLAPGAPLFDSIGLSGDNRIDSLISGYKWPAGTVTYSFYEDSVFAGAYYGSETGVREVSEPVKTNVRAIMALLGETLNLTFVEVTETNALVGSIRFMFSNGPTYAYAYLPSDTFTVFHVSGDVHLNPTYDCVSGTPECTAVGGTNGWQNGPGKHGYMSLIHEIGHALGFKHPHEGSPRLPSDADNSSYTVMSYNFVGASSGTIMPFDLHAFRYMYGSRVLRSSNTTYSFPISTDEPQVSGTSLLISPNNTKFLIVDTGGINTVDLSGLPAASGGMRVDINEGGWIVPNSAFQATYFDYGSVVSIGTSINDVVSSPFNDTIYANSYTNTFKGSGAGVSVGADTIYGAQNSDILDLSAYAIGSVTQTVMQNDRVFTLGAFGSITVKDFEIGAAPTVVFQGQSTPTPTATVVGTSTFTPPATSTQTPLLSPTPTATPTRTFTPSRTVMSTATATLTATASSTPTATATFSWTPTIFPSPVATVAPTETSSPVIPIDTFTPVPAEVPATSPSFGPSYKLFDFHSVVFEAYGGRRNGKGIVEVGVTGETVRIEGDAWRSFVLPEMLTPSSVLIGELRVSGSTQFAGIGIDDGGSYGQRELTGTYFQVGGSGNPGKGNYQLKVVGPVPVDRWVKVIIPLKQVSFGRNQRLIFASDVAKGERAEVSFRRFGVFDDTGFWKIEEPQQFLIEIPDEGDSSFCSISGECRALSKGKTRCVVRALRRSVNDGYLSDNARISFSVADRGWAPIGGGYTSVVTGVLERRFNTNTTLRKNRFFGLVDFPEVGCRFSQQLQ